MLSEDYSGSVAAKHGQRRQVTVLFADMVGYTALAETLGEEQTYHVMQQVHKELHEAVHGHSGTVQENTGDGIMALFGAPVAVENAPLHACRAAMDLQDRISALGRKIEAQHGVRPTFRVGIHSGPLVVGEVGDHQKSAITALGDTVNLASRIEAQAEPGQTILSDATHALVQSFVTCSFVGAREIKGKREAQNLWSLEKVMSHVSSFDVAIDKGLTPFIGRGTDLSQLEKMWAETSERGLRAAVITGEAGSGKSRLVHELHQLIGDEKALFLEGHCDSGNQGKPFAPLIEVIRSSFRISPDAGAETAKGKLVAGLEILGIDAAATMPYLLQVLGLQDDSGALADVAHETLGIRIRDAILEMLAERCRMSPTVIVLDGMQWADSASEELIARCLNRLQDLPLLLIITARAGYAPDWIAEPGVQEIRLVPLTDREMSQFIKANLGVDDVPEALADLITGKAQGNPLFAEEIIDHLGQSGSIEVTDGKLELGGDVSTFTLPSTVENLLMDQFDQLEPIPRTILEVASVIGTRFSRSLVAAASGSEEDFETHLRHLADKELVRAEPGSSSVSFSKALARDAIYDSMLTPRRQALHRNVAEALESSEGAYPDEIADQLAFHWQRSDVPSHAIKHLARAGEAALRVYALDEADQHFTQALELIGTPTDFENPVLVADIFLNYARVLYFKLNFNRVLDISDRYKPLFESLGDKARYSRFLFEVGYLQVFKSKVEEGRETLSHARRLGEEGDDELAIAYADLGFMWERSMWGEHSQARTDQLYEMRDRLVEVGLKHGDTWIATKASLALAFDRFYWGQPAQSQQVAMDMIALSRKTNDPRPKAMAFYTLSAISAMTGDYDTSLEQAEEALRISLSPIDRNLAQSMRGIALIFKRDIEKGLTVGAPSVSAMANGGSYFNTSIPRAIIGAGKLMHGDLTTGMEEVQRARQEPHDWEQSVNRPVLDMILAEVYMEIAVGDDKPDTSAVLKNLGFVARTVPFAKSKARKGLEKAILEFKAMDCTSHVARALINLARLDIAAKQGAKARERLDEAMALAASVSSEGLKRLAQEQLQRL